MHPASRIISFFAGLIAALAASVFAAAGDLPSAGVLAVGAIALIGAALFWGRE